MSIREIDPREAKLPKWARETLDGLRAQLRNAEQYVEELTASPSCG